MGLIKVSPTNPNFRTEVAAAQARWRNSMKNRDKPLPKYWQGHVRVAGLKQRDGPGVIVSLPIKLVPPGSAPPPEAAQELMDSSLLRRLSATRVTTLFSDGAPAWPKAVKAVPGNIKAVAVSHNNF